jgi:hypothetical protein
MLEQYRNIRANKVLNPLVQGGWQGRIREHPEQDILLQQLRVVTRAEREEWLLWVVHTLDITPWRRLLPQQEPMTEMELESHIAPQDGYRGKAEIIILLQHLFMGGTVSYVPSRRGTP